MMEGNATVRPTDDGGEPPAAPTTASAGEPLPEGEPVANEEAVVAALKTVFDPEIPVNIYDLGLIYGLAVGGRGDVDIRMTLTSPNCPVAGELPGNVAHAAASVPGTGRVNVALTFDPPWTPELMSEDAKLALGMD